MKEGLTSSALLEEFLFSRELSGHSIDLCPTALKGPFAPTVSENSIDGAYSVQPLGKVVPSKAGGDRILLGVTSKYLITMMARAPVNYQR